MHDLPSRSSVGLTVPATSAYLRHLRVVAATVADDLGFDVDAIESLRVAVDELCALAIADATPTATLSLTMEGGAEGLLTLRGRCGPVDEDPVLDPIAEQLLRAGSDTHALAREGGDCVFELTARPATAAAVPDGR